MAITDPTDIASLKAWYDASDGATITLDGSSHVTQWNDKSGNSKNLISAGAIAVASAALNSLDTLHFPASGNADILSLGSNASPVQFFGGDADKKRSYAFVVRFDAANPGGLCIAGYDTHETQDNGIWLVNDSNTKLQMLVSGSGPKSDVSLALGEYYVVVITCDLNFSVSGQLTAQIYINGSLETKSVSVTSTWTLNDGALRIGDISAGLLLNGYVAEAAFFDDVLTSGEAADLYDYFQSKWFGVSDSITFTDFADRQVIQRGPGATSKTVTLAGTYTGSPTAIEYRIVEDGTDTAIPGHDWRTLDAAPSGGSFAGDVDVPQGGWYNIDLRFAGGSSPLFGGANRWGVGMNVFMLGQSNMHKMRETSETPPSADSLVSMVATGSWAPPAGNGVIALGNALASALSMPIGLVEYAVDGSAIDAWDPGADWTAALAGLNAADGDCEFVLWHQGETDAINGTTKASYKASLANVYAQCLSATGRSAAQLPFLVGLLGRVVSAPYDAETDATWQAIKDAHLEFVAETTGAYLTANLVDLPHDSGGTDQLHLSGAGYETAAARYAQTILEILGDAAYGGTGPQIASATIAGSTVLVDLAHDGGDDFTPTSGITGFEVLDDGTPITINSAVRQDANRIALTLASAPSGTVTLRYQYGEEPDISGLVVDNTALALPLLYANDLTVGAAPATTGVPYGAERLSIALSF